MNEVWKDIKGYEGKYQVSDTGKVRSLDYHRQEKVKELALKNSRGYYIVGLTMFSKKKFYSVHRLVANAFIPNGQNLPQVNHIDCNKANNNVSNLEWVTEKENTIHAIGNGLFAVSQQKLKEANVKRRKAVLAIEIKSGNKIFFESTRRLSMMLDIDRKQCKQCLIGKAKSAKGYLLKYVD